jgi:hypothetical protein
MRAIVEAYRRGGVVSQRTACKSDRAWDDHRTAVLLEVKASMAAQRQGFGLLGLQCGVQVFLVVPAEVGVRHDTRTDVVSCRSHQ